MIQVKDFVTYRQTIGQTDRLMSFKVSPLSIKHGGQQEQNMPNETKFTHMYKVLLQTFLSLPIYKFNNNNNSQSAGLELWPLTLKEIDILLMS